MYWVTFQERLSMHLTWLTQHVLHSKPPPCMPDSSQPQSCQLLQNDAGCGPDSAGSDLLKDPPSGLFVSQSAFPALFALFLGFVYCLTTTHHPASQQQPVVSYTSPYEWGDGSADARVLSFSGRSKENSTVGTFKHVSSKTDLNNHSHTDIKPLYDIETCKPQVLNLCGSVIDAALLLQRWL